jgi:hypothetical protein
MDQSVAFIIAAILMIAVADVVYMAVEGKSFTGFISLPAAGIAFAPSLAIIFALFFAFVVWKSVFH